MHTTLLALGALASVAVADMGKAIVLNKCSYPVKLCNVPAKGAGFQQVDKILASGDNYEQTWTKIGDVEGGWSIKLSKNLAPGGMVAPILQYEYTCKEDGVIWYDLSMVDGNPWQGQDWEISANDGSGCNPKQAAYRFWNDDANGMQDSCPESTDITVTLCPNGGGSSGNSTSPAPSPAAPAPAPVYSPAPAPKPSPAPAPKPSPAPAPATSSPAPAPAPTYAPVYPQKQEATTLETSSQPAKTHVVATTVVEVETVYATAYVTVAPQKRHVHHPHQHGHA